MLENTPAEYITVLKCEKLAHGYALNIEDLQESTKQLYRTLYGNKGSSNDDTKILLSSNYGSKIICYLCKKEGHTSYQCPDKHNVKNKHSGNRVSSQGRRKFSGSFSRCGKEGHKNADCWENPQNDNKRPLWYWKDGGNRKELWGTIVSNSYQIYRKQWIWNWIRSRCWMYTGNWYVPSR